MNWELSEFGQRLGQGSGIGQLMQDLGDAIAHGGPDICLLGGGQPAHIAEVDAVWKSRIDAMLHEPGKLEHALGNYEPPQGNPRFRAAMAQLLRDEYGWDVGPENIGVTAGGQTAFFLLFNALAGKMPDGLQKRILLPLLPEYIGYASQSVQGSLFHSQRPIVERIGSHEFKYHVDFDSLEIDDSIAAICVSRPTNPSGNVLTDHEISKLADLAKHHSIPLMIDNAYGLPFPGAIFTSANLIWDEHIVLTLSLSKIGLPATRTGVVIARPEIISMLASMTSIVGLANTNIGQAITTPLIESGEIMRLARDVVRPFYEQKSLDAKRFVSEIFDDEIPYRIHVSEGAFFLWFWFEGLPITSQQLYQRLKEREVLVIPGDYFFFGDETQSEPAPWRHRDECIRMTFTMPEAMVRRGLAIIAEEVSMAYGRTDRRGVQAGTVAS